MSPSKVNDYTPEEQAMIERVEAEQQDRKRLLYEKQVKEQEEKNKRKQKA